MSAARFVRLRQPWRWLPFRVRLQFARLRAVLVRRRLVRRLITGVIVGVVLWWIMATIAQADQIRDRWGPTSTVVVAVSDHEIGDDVDPTSFELVDRPTAFLPDDVLDVTPTEDRVVGPLRAGDVVTERHLASARGDGIGVGAHERAIGIPTSVGPPVRPGDLIDLLVLADRLAGSTDNVEVGPATVLLVDETMITVAVPAGETARISEALLSGRVAIALR